MTAGQLKAVLCALNSEPVLEWEMVNDMHYVTFPSSFLLVLRRGGAQLLVLSLMSLIFSTLWTFRDSASSLYPLTLCPSQQNEFAFVSLWLLSCRRLTFVCGFLGHLQIVCTELFLYDILLFNKWVCCYVCVHICIQIKNI